MRRNQVLVPAAIGLALILALSAAPVGSAQQAPAAGVLPPPLQFRAIALGMGIDDVKNALKADPLFRYRGDPDVSFLPQTSQYLIECDGTTYIRRAYFQFADGRLFIMILVLDPLTLDHYSLFSAFSAKYGPPASLSPEESVWQSTAVRFSLERPLTVKYVDNKTFTALQSESGGQKDLELLSRESFIGQF